MRHFPDKLPIGVDAGRSNARVLYLVVTRCRTTSGASCAAMRNSCVRSRVVDPAARPDRPTAKPRRPCHYETAFREELGDAADPRPSNELRWFYQSAARWPGRRQRGCDERGASSARHGFEPVAELWSDGDRAVDVAMSTPWPTRSTARAAGLNAMNYARQSFLISHPGRHGLTP